MKDGHATTIGKVKALLKAVWIVLSGPRGVAVAVLVAIPLDEVVPGENCPTKLLIEEHGNKGFFRYGYKHALDTFDKRNGE